MVSAGTSRFIVGVIGNIVSFGLFLSPLPTFFRIWKKKSVEEFSPIPYIATTLNCVLWVFYGIVHPDSILVASINSVGLAIELAYVATFFAFANAKGRKYVAKLLLAEAVFFAAVVLVTMLALHDVARRSLVLGVVCDIFNILMYASPLVAIKRVIQTKSTEFMPFWLSLTNFVNACIWTAYALIQTLDPYVLTSNGLGTIFGLAQLIVIALFRNSTPKNVDVVNGEDQKVEKPSELELSAAANAESIV